MSTSNNCRVTLRGQGSGNRQEPSNTSRVSQVGPTGPFATAFGSPSGTHPPTDLYDQFPNLPNQPHVPNGPNLSTLANLPNLPNLPTLPNLPQQNSFSHDVVFYYPATAPRPWKPPAAKSRINQVGLLMPPNANVPTLVPQPVWCFHVSDTTPMPRKLPAAIRRTIEVGPLQASGGLRPHTVDEPCEGPVL